MRACFSVCSLRSIPRKWFKSSGEIVDEYGYHPKDFLRILKAKVNPCLKVRFNGVIYYFYDMVLYEQFLEILRKCIDIRGEIVCKNLSLSRKETETLIWKNKKVRELSEMAKLLEQSGTPEERITKRFKLKIIKWENQTRI